MLFAGSPVPEVVLTSHGVVEQAWFKISPCDTPKKLLEAVGK